MKDCVLFPDEKGCLILDSWMAAEAFAKPTHKTRQPVHEPERERESAGERELARESGGGGGGVSHAEAAGQHSTLNPKP